MSSDESNTLLERSREALASSRKALAETIADEAELGRSMERSAQTSADHQSKDDERKAHERPPAPTARD